jgi:hypothetical protein
VEFTMFILSLKRASAGGGLTHEDRDDPLCLDSEQNLDR